MSTSRLNNTVDLPLMPSKFLGISSSDYRLTSTDLEIVDVMSDDSTTGGPTPATTRSTTPTLATYAPVAQIPTKVHAHYMPFEDLLASTTYIDAQNFKCPGSDLVVPAEYEKEPEFVKIAEELNLMLSSDQHIALRRPERFGWRGEPNNLRGYECWVFYAYFSKRFEAYNIVKARKAAEASGQLVGHRHIHKATDKMKGKSTTNRPSSPSI